MASIGRHAPQIRHDGVAGRRGTARRLSCGVSRSQGDANSTRPRSPRSARSPQGDRTPPGAPAQAHDGGRNAPRAETATSSVMQCTSARPTTTARETHPHTRRFKPAAKADLDSSACPTSASRTTCATRAAAAARSRAPRTAPPAAPPAATSCASRSPSTATACAPPASRRPAAARRSPPRSAAVELVEGAGLLDAARIGSPQIAAELGGLSAGKLHAADLASDALHRALGAAVRAQRRRSRPTPDRTLVAMSGGVDSAVAALLVRARAGRRRRRRDARAVGRPRQRRRALVLLGGGGARRAARRPRARPRRTSRSTCARSFAPASSSRGSPSTPTG